MNPRITVLLPTHDRPDVLSFAIESVLWQTEEDFELLVVGDGCTDATRDVVRRFSDRRIRWFDLPKGPLSGYNNRNAALQEARGHYIAYGQDDDIFLPDHLARLAAELDATGSEWGYCRTLWCVPKGYLLPVLVNLTNPDELDWFINTGNSIPSSSVMHTRESLARAGYWPTDMPKVADYQLWRRIIGSSDRGVAYSTAATLVHFRARSRDRDIGPVHAMETIAEGAAWWPAACRLDVEDGVPEQATLFLRLLQDPTAGREIQRAAASAADRIAWGTVFRPADTWSATRATPR